MNNLQKAANENFFKSIISLTKENGVYVWPDANESFTIKGGKLLGTSRGVNLIKGITGPSFHKNLGLK